MGVQFSMVTRCRFIFIVLCTIINSYAQDDFINTIFEELEKEKDCLVKEVNSKTTKTCQFPFIYENKTFYGCTTYLLDKQGAEISNAKSWCSTKNDPITMEMVTGNGYYGDCPQDGSCTTAEEAQEAEDIWEHNEMVNIGWDSDLGGTGTRSGGSCRQNNVECECKELRSCPWVTNLIRDARNLRNKDRVIRFISDRSCSRSGQTFAKVYCCDGEFPTNCKLRKLKNPDSSSPQLVGGGGVQTGNRKGINSGKWKPNSKKGECGMRNVISNIVGGKKAKLGDFPYMALLGKIAQGDGKILYSCGGSLINKWYVLTAAHCVKKDNGELSPPNEIVLGEHEVGRDPDCQKFKGSEMCSPPKIARTVAKVIVHEKYVGTSDGNKHDIALLRLNESVPLIAENRQISVVSPVCLPWSED